MRCEQCPARNFSWCQGEFATRLCELAITSEPYRNLIVRIAAAGPNGSPAPVIAPVVIATSTPSPRPDPFTAACGPCVHREAHWRCNSEVSLTCRLGLGQAGIIDEADCRGCDRAEFATGDKSVNDLMSR